ncbi:MAG: toll/interleukin-1 receptor domain-containing protein, partial [Verrucomicrobiota bacterium]
MAVPPPTPPSVQASVDLLSPAYWAFVSYAHLDNRQEGRMWASWLCQRLETFEIPEEFVGQHNEKGDLIPERLSPIFRDEEELPAGHDLSEAIYAALERSKFLIVICSRNAVKSDHVAQEILYFKQLGRADRILAVMIDGEPNASWNEAIQRKGSSPYDECFPDSLIHPLTTQDKEGVLDKERTTEPIASDFRLPGGLAQGWTHSSFYRTSLEGEG